MANTMAVVFKSLYYNKLHYMPSYLQAEGRMSDPFTPQESGRD